MKLKPAPVPRSGAPCAPQAKDDVISVASIGILAFISTDLAHEVFGHLIGLLIAGGRSGVFTTTRLIYQTQLPDPNWRIFDIGGPAGNLIWASVCYFTQRLIRQTVPTLRLFLWTTMSFSLFWEFGYLIKCGATGHGDYMAFIEGLTPVWLWRTLILALGLMLYRAAISATSSELHFVLSAKARQWRSRIVFLLVTLCSAGGLTACAGAIFDPRGWMEMLYSGATSSFAAWVGLLALPALFPRYPDKDTVVFGPVRRSLPLILLAVVSFVWFVAVLGAGIPFSL
jgi:hypothetical protein